MQSKPGVEEAFFGAVRVVFYIRPPKILRHPYKEDSKGDPNFRKLPTSPMRGSDHLCGFAEVVSSVRDDA